MKAALGLENIEPMTVLVTGADGQLGTALRAAIRRMDGNNCPDRYIFTDRADLDITDASAVSDFVTANKVNVIINCAAYTDVEGAQDAPEMAELLNSTAVRHLADAMKEINGTLIHISTDYVFGNTPYNRPCGEDEPANPSGIYGLTKLHGEQQIAESGVSALIFRTSWLYSETGRNFVKTMVGLTASRPVLNVVFDQAGTPTYAQDLADSIVHIINHRMFVGKEGIYNYSNEGVCSWYDFAKMIAEYAGHSSCDIRPCHSSEFPSKVVRPAYSVLDKTKFKTTFGLTVPYWTDSLKKCIRNLTQK